MMVLCRPIKRAVNIHSSMFVGIFRATQFALQNIGRQMIQAIEEKVDIRFVFYTYVPEEQILDVQTRLKEMEQVKQVRYVSQQQALEDYRADHEGDESVLAALDVFDENVLPASIIVQARDITQFSEIVDEMQRSDDRSLIDFE